MRALYRTLLAFKALYFNPFAYVARLISLVPGYLAQRKNSRFKIGPSYLYPCLTDKTSITPVDPVYFFQDAWCAQKIFAARPAHHYDVGSKIDLVSIVSQLVPVSMVDIRPLELSLPGLSFIRGSILELPFADNSLGSLSSICVIEHIGLGRYGDAIDPFGSEKAARELVRVLAHGGDLYVSVPVDREDRVYFNAHRAFRRESVLELFSGADLIEEHYIYGKEMQNAYDPRRGFGTGLYHFRKRA